MGSSEGEDGIIYLSTPGARDMGAADVMRVPAYVCAGSPTAPTPERDPQHDLLAGAFPRTPGVRRPSEAGGDGSRRLSRCIAGGESSARKQHYRASRSQSEAEIAGDRIEILSERDGELSI